MSKHLLKQALEALKRYQHGEYRNCGELIGEIEAELESPEPEPVGYYNSDHFNRFDDGRVKSVVMWSEPGCNGINTPVYTHPPRHQEPLSNEEIRQISADFFSATLSKPALLFARAIEKSHGIEP